MNLHNAVKIMGNLKKSIYYYKFEKSFFTSHFDCFDSFNISHLL